VGRWRSTVGEWIHDYIHPQENANRTDTRWLALTTSAGSGLLVASADDQLLQVSAWPYSLEDLDAATHEHLLPRRDFVTLNIDLDQKGVGDLLSALYPAAGVRLEKNIPYRYRYWLAPLREGQDPGVRARELRALV
jgi:beta-galactosidase